MGKIYEGDLIGSDLKIALVAGRFNSFITKQLLEGAEDAMRRHGVKDENVDLAWVPGAFEMPQIAQKMAQSKRYDAVITLGAVIRGATTHYDYVCQAASSGALQTSLSTDVPVIFGVVTTETIEQAIERAGTKAGNKGWDVAVAAIEVANLNRQLEM